MQLILQRVIDQSYLWLVMLRTGALCTVHWFRSVSAKW